MARRLAGGADRDTSELPGWYKKGGNPYGEQLTPDGEHNLKWWAWETGRVHSYGVECLEKGIPFKPSEWTRHLNDQMKMRGVDLSQLGNNKSDLLIMDHPEEWFELSEGSLRRMKEEATRLIKRSRDADLVNLELVAGITEEQEKKLHRAIAIIDQVIALQQFCRDEEPDFANCMSVSEGQYRLDAEQHRTVLRCLHPMRVMLYVRRSSASWKGIAEWDKIMDMAPHLSHLSISVTRTKELGGCGAMVELPPEHSKPLDVETPVLMGDGSRQRLGGIHVGDYVIGHSGSPCLVDGVYEQGSLPTVKITTYCGRVVRSALDHPFLTSEGWRNASELRKGDVLACIHRPRTNPVEPRRPDEEFRLAGYFVGDGNTTANGKVSCHSRIECYDESQAEDIIRCAEKMGFSVRVDRKCYFVNGATQWLRDCGLSRKNSKQKRVPPWVFTADSGQVANFIGAYFACDGTVNRRGAARRDACVSFCSVNRPLLEDVQHLLLRLGVRSRIRERRQSNNNFMGGEYWHRTLEITSQDDVAKFIRSIPVYGVKTGKLAEWGVVRTAFDAEFIADPIVSVEPDGYAQCRCLSVRDDHTFLANDLVVHNTEFGLSWCATEIAKNQELNWGVLHHKSEHACNRVVNLRRMMTPNNPMGRRYCALFPHVKVIGRVENQHEFTVKRRSNSKDPTVRAFGITEAVQGMDLHRIWADDIVDSRERDEETTRNRTHNSFVGNFLPRLRGDGTFFLMTYTPWHLEDCHGRLKKTRTLQEIKGRLVYDIGVFRIPIGSAHDPYQPIWDRQDRKKLMAHRKRLADGALFDCLYHLNPVSEKTRIVQKLCYVEHDPEKESTRQFLGTSRMVLSIDPTATVGRKSDRAGVVYMAVNENVPQIRIIEGFEIAANQRDLAAFIYEFMQGQPVHEIVIETVSGFHATADELEYNADYNLPDDIVTRINSHKNKDKGTRLRSVAIHFETGRIAFVGEKNEDGELKGLPRHKWMYDQILQFGATNNDHAVDAITQVAIRYAASLWDGYDQDEEVRKQVEQSKRYEKCPRMMDHWNRIRRLRENNGGSHVMQVLKYADARTCVDESEQEYCTWN